METAASIDTPIATMLSQGLYWVFLAVLLLNVVQRRHQETAQKKRFGTLYIAIALFVSFVIVQLTVIYGRTDWFLVPGLGAVIFVMYRFRSKTFPFRFRSRSDGSLLSWHEILFVDEAGEDPKTPQDQSPED